MVRYFSRRSEKMADINDIIIAFIPTITLAVGSVIMWVKTELAKREQKQALAEETELKKEADLQGDALAQLGLMLADQAIRDARKLPSLGPIIDQLEDMYAVGVEIWNDPMGCNDEMLALVEDAQELYELIKAGAEKNSVPQA